MNDMALLSIVSLIGWLIVAGGALASYRLGWSKIIQMALLWIAIFAGAYLIADLLMGL